MSELTPEDIAAAREQGDLVPLLLMNSGLTVKAPKAAPDTAAKAPPLPRRRPGAWPIGTKPPGPTPEVAAYLAQLWPGRFTFQEEDPSGPE